MSFKRAGCLAAVTAVSVLLLTVNSAHCITVKPAVFDHIQASVPAEVMAGVEFEVGVTFVDRFGNPMAREWRPDTSLTLHVSQPASVQPPVLTPENYVPGFTYSVHTEKMGNLTLSLRDDKGRVLDQWDLTIKSGRPVKLLLDMPPRAEVGETLTLSIQAVDAHGNIAYGYEPLAQSLESDDNALSIVGAVKSKAGGVHEVPVRFKAPGRRSINLRDRKRGLSGVFTAVTVSPAPLNTFEIDPGAGQAVAGRGFAVTIKALDRFGNTVTDYQDRYKGVRLNAGETQIAPDLVPPSSFNSGVARVNLTMKTAGHQSVRVSELQSSISADFSVDILPGDVDALRVSTPDSAVAGEPFQITITAEDAFGNRTPSLPPGASVVLSSTGTGRLNPNAVKADAFKDGVAKVRVSYEVAESFEIRAGLDRSGSPAAVTPAQDRKARARAAAGKAREEAMRARRESRLREKRVSEQAGAPPGPARKAPEPVKPADQPAGEAVQTAAGDRGKPAPAKVAPAPTAPTSTAKVASRGPLRPGVLDGISVKEDDMRALVTFSTNGMTNYNVTTSAKLSRKWIDIEFPDMSVDVPDRIAGGEKIVGEVYVEPSAGVGRGVTVSIEILPTRIGYDVYQEGQSLVLKVNRQ